MKVVAFTSDKGGMGKSTAALNLACAAAEDGFETAVLDLDPQASVGRWARLRRRAGLPARPLAETCVPIRGPAQGGGSGAREPVTCQGPQATPFLAGPRMSSSPTPTSVAKDRGRSAILSLLAQATLHSRPGESISRSQRNDRYGADSKARRWIRP